MIESIQNNLDLIIFTTLVIWSFVWSGIAMWRAAQNEDKSWFGIIFASMLILGVFGITGIIYICFVPKKTIITAKS